MKPARMFGNRPKPSPWLRAKPEPRAQGEEKWWPPVSNAGVAVTSETALRFSALLATFCVLSTDIAVLPLHVHRRNPDGSKERVRNDPREEILTRSPNGTSTPIRWRSALMGHALQHGNGYAEIQRLNSGMPYRLHLLPPKTTRPTKTATGLAYRTYDRELGNRVLPFDSVIHLAGFGPDGTSGYDLVSLMSTGIGLGLAAQEYGADYFANGAEPGGVIEVPQRLDDEAYQHLRESWRDEHGRGNRHSPAILEQGAKWTGTTTDPEKAQLIEAQRYQVEDVARPWRVPPNKLGNYRDAHYANVEAGNTDYLMTALMGWLEAWEQEFNLKLFSRREWLDGLFVEHDVNALLRGDIVSRFNAYHQALEDGWMNRNEVRARENMNAIRPEDGGDKYLVQLAKTTLDQAGAVPTPPTTTRTE